MFSRLKRRLLWRVIKWLTAVAARSEYRRWKRSDLPVGEYFDDRTVPLRAMVRRRRTRSDIPVDPGVSAASHRNYYPAGHPGERSRAEPDERAAHPSGDLRSSPSQVTTEDPSVVRDRLLRSSRQVAEADALLREIRRGRH